MGNFIPEGRPWFGLFAQEIYMFVYIIKCCVYTKLQVYREYVKNKHTFIYVYMQMYECIHPHGHEQVIYFARDIHTLYNLPLNKYYKNIIISAFLKKNMELGTFICDWEALNSSENRF